jgi:hypothetical protein
VLCILVLGPLAGTGRAEPLGPGGGPPGAQAGCPVLPAGCRERIHIYMINGLSLLPCLGGSMTRLAPCIEALGFCKPKVASHYSRWAFQNDIRRVHREDPRAHFVLVGYSMGGGVVHAIAQALEKDGIFIDLMVYIDAHGFFQDLNRRPSNVGKIVSMNCSSWLLAGKGRPGEECHHIDTCFHLAAPRQKETLQILAGELFGVAACCGGPGH